MGRNSLVGSSAVSRQRALMPCGGGGVGCKEGDTRGCWCQIGAPWPGLRVQEPAAVVLEAQPPQRWAGKLALLRNEALISVSNDYAFGFLPRDTDARSPQQTVAFGGSRLGLNPGRLVSWDSRAMAQRLTHGNLLSVSQLCRLDVGDRGAGGLPPATP